ncbi:hypothetical protein GCM10009721_38540 [Terrabacter tumescens]|uniref:Integral membrane protein n=1 Tax=Terrabacter tumescens TaxID=60443 RepID=A0ABQ2IFB8_9MICO|nr:hypothetical protein [Terrabacter tumescens]GGN07114.1 hypothetical protein GCM10009721_38540 [Terrabacter tumescens]
MDSGVGMRGGARPGWVRARVWPVLPLAAAAWWLGGALPWVLDGLGAQSPRDWPYDVATGSATDGYISLLPFTTARLGLLVTITLIGGGIAALAVLWAGRRDRRRLVVGVLAALGALSAAAYAIAQSAGATRQLGSDFDRDDRVLLGMLAVAVAGTLLGIALGLLVVLGGPVLRALAAAPLAVALGSWVSAVLVALIGVERAISALRWTPVVVGVAAGLALVGLGLRPARRLLAWVAVLLLVAMGAAGQTAFSYLVAYLRPRSGLPDSLRDHVEASRDVFLAAIGPDRQAWGVYVVAVVVGLLGSVLRVRRPATRPTRPKRPMRGAAVPPSPATRHTTAPAQDRHADVTAS